MIYDCFTFFNELDLLEIRLNELGDTVDRFVLVEATLNHQGKEKPLYYNENKERFSKFSSKIIHIIVDQYPANPEGNAWVFERHQRNMILQGLKDCRRGDAVIVSDVDEIPDKEKIKSYRNRKGVKIFRQRMFYYFINCVNATVSKGGSDEYRWNGSVMLNYEDMPKSVQVLREISIHAMNFNHPRLIYRIHCRLWMLKNALMRGLRVVMVDEGGWHFSYLGGVELIIRKLEAFAHSEYNKDEYKDPKKIEEAIKSGKDIFGRGFEYRFIPLDDSFPAYIVKNAHRYPRLINLEAAAK